jgi:2-alkyl-3-oxoalkanoate reductase
MEIIGMPPWFGKGDGNMPVLVTGATGLIGSHVVDLLVERAESVRALVRPGEVTDRLVSQGVDICLGDMKDRASLAAAVTGVDRVIHCAARTGPWGPRGEYEATNVLGLEDLIELSLAAGVQRFVHVSSVIVYGADVGGAADETAPMYIEPHNPYNWSKVIGERVVEKYIKEKRAAITVVRPGWVYGPRDGNSFGRFASMVKNEKMVVIGSGKNHVPLVYVTDVAEGILLASSAQQAVGEAFTFVNDELVTQNEFFEAIAQELQVPAPRIHVPYRLARLIGESAEAAFQLVKIQQSPPLTRYGAQLLGGENRLSIQKARRELGWSPHVNLAEGVRRGIAWFRTIDGAKSE